jgi:hypothetical protein
MQYVGIDWAYRRAAWCAKQADGTIAAEGFVAADEDGLARLVIELGPEVRACLEMMSGAVPRRWSATRHPTRGTARPPPRRRPPAKARML